MDFKCLINELIESAVKTEPNFEKFDSKYFVIDNLEGIILKIKKMNKIKENKIVFLGRCGSMKNELILNLVKLKLSQVSISKIKDKFIEYISENNNYGILVGKTEPDSNDGTLVDDKTERIEFESVDSLDKYIQSNYSTFSSHIKIFYPRSENEILKDKIVMDTLFYDYSDERDDVIVNNCRDGQIFIVVLDAVEIIGYRDKNFLKRLSENNFIKLIFIFNCMEQVSNEDYHRTKGQHTTNATRISNEILFPSQENIPIFFIANCQLNADYLLTNTVFNEKTMQDYFEEIKEKIKQAKNLITTEKEKIDKLVSQKEEEFDDYEEQRNKADDENKIIDKKNEHIANLKKMIRTISYSPNDINGPPKNLYDIFQLFINFCDIRQSGKKFFTDNCGDSDMQKTIEGEIPKNIEKNEILKKQLNNIIDELKKLWGKLSSICPHRKKWHEFYEEIAQLVQMGQIIDENFKNKFNFFVNDYNKSLGKISKDNNYKKSPHQSKSKDQSSSSKKEDDKNNEEMSEYIENQLNDIENNIEEFNKYSLEYRSFLTEYFQYILQLLNYINNNVWTGDFTKSALKETPTFPAIPDKLIEKINFIEIESFNVLLIFVLLIKIFIGKIINKLKTDHHKENMEILNNNLLNTKLFDKLDQIKFIKCERNTEYSKSVSDSLETIILENKNKLNILNEDGEKIINLMEELEKNI